MNTPTRVLECIREADAVKGVRPVTSGPRRRPFLRLGLLGLTAAVLLGCKTLKFDTLLNHQDDAPTKSAKNDKGDKGEKSDKGDRDGAPGAPSKYSVRVSQFLFLSDFELKRDLPLFQDLSDLREQVTKELQLPGANTVVNVYIFEDKEHYERYMTSKYKDLPKRRAFFVAQPHSVGGPEDLSVYTYWTVDRIREDLRHELTHALLHSVLKDVPLWLDEGLAEYFELPPERKGVNQVHLDQLRRGSFQPNLKRLESLTQVQDMGPPEYREAWAWVHLMLHDKHEAKGALLGYLQQLRSRPNAGALSDRLVAVYSASSPEETLQAHLAQIEVPDPTRTQTAVVTPVSTGHSRRGFIRHAQAPRPVDE
jgi:hypothetical protein